MADNTLFAQRRHDIKDVEAQKLEKKKRKKSSYGYELKAKKYKPSEVSIQLDRKEVVRKSGEF